MDNDRIKFFGTNKGLMVDPNNGDNNVPLENLNITVDLFVMKRPRSYINVEEGEKTFVKIGELNNGTAPFFAGDSKENLNFTTNYTNISSEDFKGKETLGIESLDIDFNSALMPLISMNLVDIRGIMHQLGPDSPYNAFFSFPYPIFKLIIKGYYGKPVEYLIHLTDYNASMDSNSGNFKMSTKFTGYTYAYLSDMLLGLLKAAPYTTEGKRMVNQKRLEDPDFITFDELYEYAKALNKKIIELREDDEDMQSLSLGYKKISELNLIKTKLVNKLNDVDIQSFNILSRTGDFIFMKNYDVDVKEYLTKSLNEIVIKTEKLNKDKTFINPDLFELKENVSYFNNLLKKDFLDEDGVIRDNYVGDKYDFFKDDENFRQIAYILEKNDGINSFDLLNFKKTIKIIDKEINNLKNNAQIFKENLTDKFFDKISELKVDGKNKSFDFNIKNYTKVLCDHVDILMSSIKQVSASAESDSVRNSDLSFNNREGNFDVNQDDSVNKIYAFPEYRKKKLGSNTLETTWIGNDFPYIDEVRFIDELYNGLVKSKRIEKSYEAYLHNYDAQWFAVNPFDTMLFTNKNSPWSSMGNVTDKYKIMRFMGLRATMFLGVSNKNISSNEAKAMGKLEANNAFNSIENGIIKTSLTTFHDDDESLIQNTLKDILVNGKNSNVDSGVGTGNEGRLFKTLGNGDLEYLHIYDVLEKGLIPMTEEYEFTDDAHFFVPLYFNSNVDEFDGKTLHVDGESSVRVDKRKRGDIFFDDISSSNNSEIDTGATYIEIIDEAKYYAKEFNNPNYSGRIIEGHKINNNYKIKDEDLGGDFKNILFNGRFNVNEFVNYNDDDAYGFYTYFYANEENTKPMFASPLNKEGKRTDVGRTIKALVSENNTLVNVNFNVPKIGFGEDVSDYEPYSLFGSEYYNHQSNVGRALLFLHCIPFKGLISSEVDYDYDAGVVGKSHRVLFNKDILNIFNNKASFIEVPYTWILLIGGLIYRMEDEEVLKFEVDGETLLPLTDEGYQYPERDEYLKTNNLWGTRDDVSHNYEDTGNIYHKIDDIIRNLPISVKNKFKKEFTDWVDSDEFMRLRNKLELFTEESTRKERELFWVDFNLQKSVNPREVYDNGIINKVALENYDDISQRQVAVDGIREVDVKKQITPQRKMEYYKERHQNEDIKGSFSNFSLKLKDGSEGVITTLDLLRKKKIIVNGTWRIWDKNTSKITVNRKLLYDYGSNFIKEFKRLHDNSNNEDELEIFDTSNNEEIYLSLYKNIKSIKDKWVNNYGDDGMPFKNLINSFNFVDRGYNKIGEKFKLNPMMVSNLLTSNYNHSLYAHMSRVLSDNNFDFIALPNFIDYGDKDDMVSIFSTYDYDSETDVSKPAFMCMYVGERSNSLELENSFGDDGINFTEDNSEIPDDFKEVPAFFVKYGDLNQSIFKNLELNQSEFGETNESLLTTDQIASSYNNVNSIGQNLYNVYTNRAYNATVEMLGNAMIQPFMYFQLHNVPMFRGGYIITKVSHSIKPNHMTTKFKGNRVKRHKTKLLDKVSIFENLIGDFTDIETKNANIDKLYEQSYEDNIDDMGNKREISLLDAESNNPEAYMLGYNSIEGEGGIDFGVLNSPSNTKKGRKYMNFSEIITEVSDLTGVNSSVLTVIGFLESRMGSSSIYNEYAPNNNGYVGVNQLSQNVFKDVEKKLEGEVIKVLEKAKTLPNEIGEYGVEYDFLAAYDYKKNKLFQPKDWSDPIYNVLNTNSLYSDYLNILATALYIKTNVRYVESKSESKKINYSLNINNVTDVYLCHQQGAAGLTDLVSNSNDPVHDNMINNIVDVDINVIKTKIDFYLYYAGKAECFVKDLDNTLIKVGKNLV